MLTIGRLPIAGVDIILASKSPQRLDILKNVGGLGGQVGGFLGIVDGSYGGNRYQLWKMCSIPHSVSVVIGTGVCDAAMAAPIIVLLL